MSVVNMSEQLQIELTDTMAEAGRKIFAEQFAKMRDHQEGSRTGEDIESVHQMRVATRRMRSLFKLIGNYYKPKTVSKYNRHLKEIARSLGQIRDLDVLILDLQEFQTLQNEETQAIVGSIVEKLDKQRRKQQIMLNAFLDSSIYQKFLKRFESFTQKQGKGTLPVEINESPHQIRHLVPLLLHERLAIVRAYDTVLDDAEDEVFHALRVEFKQLRYAVEFFLPILGSSAKNFINDVKAMQDLLGRMNDIAVFTERVHMIKRVSDEQHTVIESYCEARNQELGNLRTQFADQWQSFNQRTTQRQLSDALLVLR